MLLGDVGNKAGATEAKHMQNLYKVLGTPHVVGYAQFSSLPLAKTYGDKIVVCTVCMYICILCYTTLDRHAYSALVMIKINE